MALTVTPGGPADDSLVDRATFESYCDLMGFDYSAFTEDQRDTALRRGTIYVEGLSSWPGQRATTTQRRLFPRSGLLDADGLAYPSDTVPPPVQDAVCEAAFFDLGSPGVLNKALDASAKKVLTKVDKISWTLVGADGDRGLRVELTAVTDLLRPIMIGDTNFFFGSAGGSFE